MEKSELATGWGMLCDDDGECWMQNVVLATKHLEERETRPCGIDSATAPAATASVDVDIAASRHWSDRICDRLALHHFRRVRFPPAILTFFSLFFYLENI